jgi:hypothetical protein
MQSSVLLHRSLMANKYDCLRADQFAILKQICEEELAVEPHRIAAAIERNI